MMRPIRIVLAEDYAIVRAGLRNLLSRLPGVEVIAEVANGREALCAVQRLHPTVVIMDIPMPDLNGLEALSRISKEFPAIKVLILSLYLDSEHVREAFERGAAGYLSKAASPPELAMAIEAITQGKPYLDSRITHIVTTPAQHAGERICRGEDDQPEPSPLAHLTSRQREVLQLVVEGKSNKEIAALLNVTVKTVEVHRGSLMKRLRIHNLAGLVRYAVRHGIIPLD